ncbi:MAG: hypothetical protein HYX53_04125 [Chloroflexi bacterium]|nr:hypothetical protein [Chloroflexota bacterium]
MGRPLARAGLLGALVAIVIGSGMAQFARRASACGDAGPYDFDTWEAEDYLARYGRAIELATAGKLLPNAYNLSTTNEPIDVRFQGLLKGPRATRTKTADKTLVVPPTIFKAIAWVESDLGDGWGNAASTVPYGGVGPVLRSGDCGYGMAQITSTMGNATGVPSARQAIIGTDYLFNIAEGVRILADKWNSAPNYRPIAGTGDPAALEDWYFAIWSYNGFAFSNHPLNPNKDPLRGDVWSCGDPKAPGAGVFKRSDYTYQELVYGCMRNPPTKNGKLVWPVQTFEAPKMAFEAVAKAFQPETYDACDALSFVGGCPAMDYPTTIPELSAVTHRDTTTVIDSGEAASFLGDPRLAYSGPTTMALTAYKDGTATSGTVTVQNLGKGIGPYRIRTSAPWIVVRHPTDPPLRTLDGGVVVGQELDVVLTKAPRTTQKGYISTLQITLNTSLLPPGSSSGKVWIEPLLGGGGAFEVTITAANGANSYVNRRVVPNLANDN